MLSNELMNLGLTIRLNKKLTAWGLISLEDLFAPKYEHYYSSMNQGLRRILMNKAVKWAEKEVETLKNLIEEVFTQVSQPLNVVATFSNGETIYAKV